MLTRGIAADFFFNGTSKRVGPHTQQVRLLKKLLAIQRGKFLPPWFPIFSQKFIANEGSECLNQIICLNNFPNFWHGPSRFRNCGFLRLWMAYSLVKLF